MIPLNPYTIAAIAAVFGWIFRIHLAVNVAGGCTVSMFLPVAIAVAVVAAVAVLVFLIWRELWSPARLVRSTA